MQIVIHRGAHEVGGSCVELSHDGTTILLDVGLPLDCDMDEDLESHLPQPLFEQLQNGEKSIDAVILSHAHMDHYGLAGLLSVSSQNIDRLVTIFKATKETDRRLVIDFYTAEVLDRLKDYARLPQASWGPIRVCYPFYVAKYFEKLGLNDIIQRHLTNGINWRRLNEIENKAVMLIRPGFLWDIKKFLDLKGATWIYSMWPGYFEKSSSLRKLKLYLESKNVRYEYIHTSGHAMLSDLKRMATAMSPDMVIPIHSFHPDHFQQHFSNVRRVEDREIVNL